MLTWIFLEQLRNGEWCYLSPFGQRVIPDRRGWVDMEFIDPFTGGGEEVEREFMARVRVATSTGPDGRVFAVSCLHEEHYVVRGGKVRRR